MLAWSRRFVASLLLASRSAFALSPIEIKGSKFFTSDGDQFYVKGITYSPDMNNANNLVDGNQCEIDAKLIQQVGANVIRVYSVDPTLSHERCMNAFADAGIYVLIDMTTPKFSINRADPEWTTELRNAFAQVIDGFQQYDNLLGFFAGNEVVNDARTSTAAPYAKAAIADMKAYRDLMQYRKIPIGYSSSEMVSLQEELQDYFDCGDEKIAADFFALNKYSWCGDSSMAKSGYDELYEQADGYDIPIFLSETGCHISSGDEPFRDFSDQIALLGRDMNDRYSGSIIYQWSQQVNNYGIASYVSESVGTPSLMGDYTRLSSQWATLSPAGVKLTSYDPTLTRRACPSSSVSGWQVDKDASNLPTLGLSGFTTPTARRTSSTATRTDLSGSADSVTTGISQQTTAGGGASTSNTSSPSKISPGAIAGGVLGGLVVLALILGAILFFLRRKKKANQAELLATSDNGNRESDKMVYDPEAAAQQNGYYGSAYHEMNGNGAAQELDPAKGHVTAMRANEMPPGNYVGELQEGHRGHEPPTPPLNATHLEPVAVGSTAAGSEPSPHVEAQRRREMEWLESEEVKLRQRREQLLRQNGRGGEE